METRTITIKSFEKTSGKKKDQTEWHRISIKATDGKFYSSFRPIAEAALVPGAQLEVKVTQSLIKENTFDIEKVLGFTLPADSTGQAQSGAITKTASIPPAFDDAEAYARYLLKKQKGEEVEEPDPLPAQIEQADSYASELGRRARRIAQEITPEWEGMSEYPSLLATIIQTMHGRITNIEIAAQDEKKYKMWGKK